MGSMMKGFKVKNVKDSNTDFYVEFKGPTNNKLDIHYFIFFWVYVEFKGSPNGKLDSVSYNRKCPMTGKII